MDLNACDAYIIGKQCKVYFAKNNIKYRNISFGKSSLRYMWSYDTTGGASYQ